MKFKKIACADNPGLPQWVHQEIQKKSEAKITWIDSYPKNNEEIIANIGDADCALVSWNTIIDKQVIDACPNLKYIGMCCSLIDENSANVDIKAARDKGIIVKGVRDYGDEGVIEFIISELVQLLKGTGKHQWKTNQIELGNQKIGIIGMGATGAMLANAARFFGMDVYYYSRTRKPEIEDNRVQYLPLNNLLETVDIISLHLPKNTELLTAEHFERFGNNKILINTVLGISFPMDAFVNWMSSGTNYAIFDKSGMATYEKKFGNLPGMIYRPIVSGFTSEAKDRLAQKVLDNLG